MHALCESLGAEMEERGLRGATLTLKLKTDTFDIRTRDSSADASAAPAVGAAMLQGLFFLVASPG